MNFIYITTNLINGKKYVGSHKGDPNDSYLGSGRILKSAIKKYGKENFKREIIEECSPNENLFFEEKYIKEMNTIYPNGYNLNENGGFNIFDDNLRKKLSDIKIGLPSPNRGRKFSEETKKRMSESAKKRKRGPRSCDTKKKISHSIKGTKRSEETRKKLSDALSGRKLSTETKEKMAISRKGKPLSEEWKKNIAESKKGSLNPMYGKIPWNKKIEKNII